MKTILLLILGLMSATSYAQDGYNLYALGNKAMNEGNYRQAEEYYLSALAKEPQNWNIYTQLGYCYHRQMKLQMADSIFRIACNNDSLNSKPFWYKGLNHVKLKQDSLAIVCYKKFISIEKKRYGNLTIAYKSIGQAYERILRKDGLYSWQIDDMIFHYEQVEIIEPNTPDIPDIKNFIELVKAKRPANQAGKWKL